MHTHEEAPSDLRGDMDGALTREVAMKFTLQQLAVAYVAYLAGFLTGASLILRSGARGAEKLAGGAL